MDYRDVLASPLALDEMLQRSNGVRKVPVIVDQGRVTIGHGGT